MAAIMEGTRFSNAVSESGANVNFLFTMDNRPDTVFIHILGDNPGFAVGQDITYAGSGVTLSGKIWYIYKTATYFNLYVRHPDPKSFAGIKGGIVYLGGIPKTQSATASQPFVSASTILHAAEESDVLQLENKTIGGSEAPTPPEVLTPSPFEAITNVVSKKTLMTGAVVIAGYLILKKLFK